MDQKEGWVRALFCVRRRTQGELEGSRRRRRGEGKQRASVRLNLICVVDRQDYLIHDILWMEEKERGIMITSHQPPSKQKSKAYSSLSSYLCTYITNYYVLLRHHQTISLSLSLFDSLSEHHRHHHLVAVIPYQNMLFFRYDHIKNLRVCTRIEGLIMDARMQSAFSTSALSDTLHFKKSIASSRVKR